ncbi:hypothetical protein B0H17DRAFT_1061751 [Mycena rosella]|uniref:Uncharacterized protein n=1 Tax=Mycena rosella TaxID=1033263 RepID=A0AAD7GFE4_MYCRO|nr:hypothetical protein B0H17DRAFT_1061751 [Mycena rosella]
MRTRRARMRMRRRATPAGRSAWSRRGRARSAGPTTSPTGLARRTRRRRRIRVRVSRVGCSGSFVVWTSETVKIQVIWILGPVSWLYVVYTVRAGGRLSQIYVEATQSPESTWKGDSRSGRHRRAPSTDEQLPNPMRWSSWAER